MTKENLIPADVFCTVHNIDITFINSLYDSGLVKIKKVRKGIYIPHDELPQLEKMTRLYFDLDINLEGMETIHHLLDHIRKMQDEISLLKNRLRFYEED